MTTPEALQLIAWVSFLAAAAGFLLQERNRRRE